MTNSPDQIDNLMARGGLWRTIHNWHLPHRINPQPGAYEENCKHGEQKVTQYLTFGIVGHLGSLWNNKKKKIKEKFIHSLKLSWQYKNWKPSDGKTSWTMEVVDVEQCANTPSLFMRLWSVVVRQQTNKNLNFLPPAILTSIRTSAASWRHMTSVPTRAMLFT